MAKPLIGLVLSGGGARGAYESGVIAYLREELPEPARSRVRFDILCGTSVGAINACWLAATADEPLLQARRGVQLWTSLVFEKALGVETLRVLRLASQLVRGRSVQPGLLDPSGLWSIVRDEIPWPAISRNIATGHVSALSVSATEVSSGRTVVFVQRGADGLPTWSRDPHVRAVRAEIRPEHALASAAIPVLFPPIAVDGTLYLDGGLRQNTPLSPALRLGADRVMVISLRVDKPNAAPPPQTDAVSLPSLFGKVLNALLLDHLDYDLDRMRRFNRLLQARRPTDDPAIWRRVEEAATADRGTAYRRVQEVLIRPSEDIGALAAKHAQRIRAAKRLTGLGARLLDWAMTGAGGEADLLSYLLFDGPYAEELVSLGRRDAAAHREDLIDFFN